MADAKCYTYLLRMGDSNKVKIGASDDPKSRVKNMQTACPEDLKLIAIIQGDCEGLLHAALDDYRIRGEWFRIDADAIKIIVDTIPSLAPWNESDAYTHPRMRLWAELAGRCFLEKVGLIKHLRADIRESA